MTVKLSQYRKGLRIHQWALTVRGSYGMTTSWAYFVIYNEPNELYSTLMYQRSLQEIIRHALFV